MSAADVFSPEGSDIAKVDNLLNAADLVVVELGFEWSHYEARMALDLKGLERVLLTTYRAPFFERPVPSFPELPIVSADDPETLASLIDQWIERTGVHRASLTEARELLKINPGLAVVSAVTVLEGALASAVDAPGRRNSIGRLLELGMSQALIPEWLHPQLREAVEVRNQTVHASGAPKVGRARAEGLVDAVERAVREISARIPPNRSLFDF